MTTPAFLAQEVLHELTYAALPAIAMHAPLYWMVFTPEAQFVDEFIWSLILIYSNAIFFVSFLMLCTIIFGVVMKANVATGMVNVNMILVIWQTFSGFFIPKDDASQVRSYFQIILLLLLHRAPFGIVTSF